MARVWVALTPRLYAFSSDRRRDRRRTIYPTNNMAATPKRIAFNIALPPVYGSMPIDD
jgi:hypothetical protein